MAVVNSHMNELLAKEQKNYKELRKHIHGIKEWHYAELHIVGMELLIEKQKEQLKQYQQFFSMLSNFMPHRPSVNDIIR